MKKGLVHILVILLLPLAYAQEIAKPGILPDNILYSLDKGIENIQIGLSGQGLPRARTYYLFAEERLAEANALADKNKPGKIPEMVINYEDNIAKANIEVEKARGIGTNLKQLETQLEISTERHIAVLELVLAKVPETAKPGIERALENAKSKSAQLKESNKKAGIGLDIVGNVVLTQEELLAKQEELRKKEEELRQKEEALESNEGLITITGFAVQEQQLKLQQLKFNMALIFIVMLAGTFMYFHHISKKRHNELKKEYSKKR